MLITSLRSSSYNSWSMCQQQFWISYVLNIKDDSIKNSTAIGSAVHLVLESAATAQLNKQNGKKFYLDDNFGEQPVNLDLNLISDLACDKIKKDQFLSFSDQDREMVHYLKNIPFEWKNSAGYKLFSPYERKIVQPEQYFDFELTGSEFTYNFDLQGKKYIGQLSLRGTIDLIVEINPQHYEIIDWKTGARKAWEKTYSPRKSYKDLENDPQLGIYYLAARHLYPHIPNWTVSIFFLKDGGPETMFFDDTHLERIKKKLKDRFDWIRLTQKPKLLINDPIPANKSKCGWCGHGKRGIDGQPVQDYNDSICHYLHKQIQDIGLERTTVIHKEVDKYSGGGSTHIIKEK